MAITINLGDWPAWVQAIGSIAAIGITLGIFRHQDWESRRRMAVASGEITFHAMSNLIERFDAAIQGEAPFALRGNRTTEMVSALRELQLSQLPLETVTAFARVRSGIYSVNERISEVFRTDKTLDNIGRRNERLESSARVLSDTLQDINLYRQLLKSYGYSLPTITISDHLNSFISESIFRAKKSK